jgi:hypothetical protein
MQTKTIYIRTEDEEMWNQLAVKASRERTSVSAIIAVMVQKYLRETAIEEGTRHERR